MTTAPISMRDPGSARYTTQDAAGVQQTLGSMRAAWPVQFSLVGIGTQSDAVSWNSTAAVVIDISLSVTNPAGTLGGGTLSIEVNTAGQSAYGGSDGWKQVVASIHIPATGAAFERFGILGKANILTIESGGPRIRFSNTGPDTVEIVAMVAPVAANPSC